MKWLGELPTTALVTLTGCICALGTAGFYFTAATRAVEIDEVPFGMWLGFVAAMLGIAYQWFGKKRDTYHASPPNQPDIEDAKAGARVPTPDPANLMRVERPSAPALRDAERIEAKPRSTPLAGPVVADD